MVFNNVPGDRVFVSWSGGKDAYLSLLMAKEQGLTVVCLLSFVGGDGYSRSHGLKKEMLQQQAAALGIPLDTKAVTWDSYEQGFTEAVRHLKEEEGVRGGVFGDVNLDEHRHWVEKMSKRCGIHYNLPLWQMEERLVAEELIKRGGKAMVVAVKKELVEQKWLGRLIDEQYIQYCLERGLSPCGESGEAHTLVIDGPLFKKTLQYSLGPIRQVDKRALVEVDPV